MMEHQRDTENGVEYSSPTKKARVTPEYTWENVHEDLENDVYSGVYGGCNAAWFGLAEARANIDMDDVHKTRSKDEYFIPELDELLKNPLTRRYWDQVVTFDPMGLWARRPTMAATTAQMNIPEFGTSLERDGKVVNDDYSINVIKCAVDYAWNLPEVSKRINLSEDVVREKLFKYSRIESVKDPNIRVFLPPLGGMTVYFFGDPRNLNNPKAEIAVRVHDSCCGSDVFGTDICTCRPYLIFAIKACVECAQRGGVGIIVYYQKEGRSLGEVTKYRVYNSRRHQPGGDRPEMYFAQTKSIAGIEDARFQDMMPDALLWLGVKRIDWLLSMSSDKYDAMVRQGIDIMQRVALPDKFVPAHADVEINAKIAAGYHSQTMAPDDVIDDLRNLEMVRLRTAEVFQLACAGKGKHFDVHLDKVEECATFVNDIIKANYPTYDIEYHSRWRHFPTERIEELTSDWQCDAIEKARRLVDLGTVSVLLDAGAGESWKYVDRDGSTYARSEGLAMASLMMFTDGCFSSDAALPHRVNSLGLHNLSWQKFLQGFQVTHRNEMAGAKGRYKMLKNLARALQNSKEFFGYELHRPGHIVDYVLKHANEDNKEVSLKVLWKAVVEGLESIWPDRSSGIRRGDIWVYNAIKKSGVVGSDMIPFHKLSQWLSLSILEPVEKLGYTFVDTHLFTGLAEYRNGGLLLDSGVLTLRQPDNYQLYFDVGSELVVEWRALTVQLLDRVLESVQKLSGHPELTIPKLLQGGTWLAGRTIAKQRRPDTGGPPIHIRSDGSVF